jgi:hypothetical protein
MLATTISTHHDNAPARPMRRFSEGMERDKVAPSALRIGRFSDGTADALVLSADRLGSFADGLVSRPATFAARRVGSFGDGYKAAADRRALPVRRPHEVAPATA